MGDCWDFLSSTLDWSRLPGRILQNMRDQIKKFTIVTGNVIKQQSLNCSADAGLGLMQTTAVNLKLFLPDLCQYFSCCCFVGVSSVLKTSVTIIKSGNAATGKRVKCRSVS